MPTKHQRIAVVVDPELSDALAAAAERLPHRSRASLLRELAMEGALQLQRREPSPIDALLAVPDVRAAKSDIREFIRHNPPAPASPESPHGLSEALEEQREDRL
ncbi:MAG: hypothetical protein J0H98_06475 [Solirubrobacterales bacterium]|nr:hypothetical protein [Solirubrobacterales bacterium]